MRAEVTALARSRRPNLNKPLCAVDALPTLRGAVRSVGAKSRRVVHGSCALIGLACRRSGSGQCPATSPARRMASAGGLNGTELRD